MPIKIIREGEEPGEGKRVFKGVKFKKLELGDLVQQRKDEDADTLPIVETPDLLTAEETALLDIQTKVEQQLQAHRAAFQSELNEMAGRNFGSLELNQRIAQRIQSTADLLRVAFACQKEGCEEAPSRLRCSLVGNSKTGVFSLCHDQKTHGGSSTVPELVLTPIPPRRKRADEPAAQES